MCYGKASKVHSGAQLRASSIGVNCSRWWMSYLQLSLEKVSCWYCIPEALVTTCNRCTLRGKITLDHFVAAIHAESLTWHILRNFMKLSAPFNAEQNSCKSNSCQHKEITNVFGINGMHFVTGNKFIVISLLFCFNTQIHSWREGQASSLCLHALWLWPKKLHRNEICSAGGKDGPHWDCQQVQDCASSRDKGKVMGSVEASEVKCMSLYSYADSQFKDKNCVCYVRD